MGLLFENWRAIFNESVVEDAAVSDSSAPPHPLSHPTHQDVTLGVNTDIVLTRTYNINGLVSLIAFKGVVCASCSESIAIPATRQR